MTTKRTARPSFFANLSSWRSSNHRAPLKPEIYIHLPAYGVNIISPPDKSQFQESGGDTYTSDAPRHPADRGPGERPAADTGDSVNYDQPPTVNDEELAVMREPPELLVLNGEIEARMPANYSPRRILGVRLVFRGIVTMDMGTSRRGETDVFFEVDVLPPVKGVLRPGSQRFEFQMSFSIDLPASDTTSSNHRIEYYVFGQLLGIEPTKASSPGRVDGKGQDRPQFSLAEFDGQGLKLPWQSGDELSDEERNIPLLEETLTGYREVTLHYNPHPNRGINRLESSLVNLIPALGMVNMRVLSDIFTIAGPLLFTYEITDIDPRTTVFAIKLSVHQKQTCTSPRDKRVYTTSSTIPIITLGTIPALTVTHPDSASPALWRGTQAGGTDGEAISGEVQTRFPHSKFVRPSTVKEVSEPPIRLEHWLAYEVWYSVHGEEVNGAPVLPPLVHTAGAGQDQDTPPSAGTGTGAGATRRLRAMRPVFFPSCSLVPHLLDLPIYSISRPNMATPANLRAPPAYDAAIPPGYDHPSVPSAPISAPDPNLYLANDPCEACGRRPLTLLCKELHKTSALPHVRHDSAAPCGVCAGKSLMPPGAPDHKKTWNCACIEWVRELGEPEDNKSVQVHKPYVSSSSNRNLARRQSPASTKSEYSS